MASKHHLTNSQLTDVLPHLMWSGEGTVPLDHGAVFTVPGCFSLNTLEMIIFDGKASVWPDLHQHPLLAVLPHCNHHPSVIIPLSTDKSTTHPSTKHHVSIHPPTHNPSIHLMFSYFTLQKLETLLVEDLYKLWFKVLVTVPGPACHRAVWLQVVQHVHLLLGCLQTKMYNECDLQSPHWWLFRYLQPLISQL